MKGVHRQGQIDHSDMYDSAFNSRASAGLNAEQVSGFQQLTHVDPQHAIYVRFYSKLIWFTDVLKIVYLYNKK